MSIFPRVVKRGKDKFVTLHMHVENHGKEGVLGTIKFVVINPSGKKKEIKDNVKIEKQSKIDKYYRYLIRKNAVIGRYLVDAKFLYKGEEARSETYKTDFFEVV